MPGEMDATTQPPSHEEHGQPPMSADEALARLIAGQERYLNGEPRYAAMRREDLAELAQGQQPYATILGCADSRVPPEIIFDAAPGELFVIRVAGNVPSPEVAGSLQYAGSHLRTPLFVVLGHDRCGAVGAARMWAICAELERRGMTVEMEGVPALVRELEAEVRRYLEAATGRLKAASSAA